MTDAIVQVLDVELSHPTDWPTDCNQTALAIFWLGALPLGAQGFAPAEQPPTPGTLRQLYRDMGAAQLAARDPDLGCLPTAANDARIVKHVRPVPATSLGDMAVRLRRLGLASQVQNIDLSLIICTRDRLAELETCLAKVRSLRPLPREIIVVDNSPLASARSLVTSHAECRYIHQPIPGLSIARNTGLNAARGALIAFTDDDARPTVNWIAELIQGFSDPAVDAVTGLVLPADLSTRAQQLFEFSFGGLSGSFLPTLFDASFFASAKPYGAQVWRIGAGANMAFRRSTLARVGLFDDRLGAGASGCSEDSEMWYRILASGGRCLYEPRAVVYHHHRREVKDLRRQLRAYMRGHVAALVVQYDRYGDRGNLDRICFALPRYLVGTFLRSLLEWHPTRLLLVTDETWGWFTGLCYLFRRRWRRQNSLRQLEEATNA